MKLTARQMRIAKAIYNQLYYMANADKWAPTYAGNKRRKHAGALLRPARTRGIEWTPADERLLRKLYPCTDTNQVAARMGRSRSSIRSRVRMLRLRKDEAHTYHHPWSKEEDRVLRRLFPHHTTAWVAQQMNRTATSVNARADRLGLRKSAAHLAATQARTNSKLNAAGVAHRFQKGLIPANKGTRRPGYGPGRMKETQFKKGGLNGQARHNFMPIGSTRLLGGYLYVKVAEVPNVPYTVNWLPVHVLEWERVNGRPLPAGHCLLFRDGNRLNVAVENLELITRAENMRRNSVHNLPKELALVVQLRGALIRQINKRSKREQPDHRPA